MKRKLLVITLSLTLAAMLYAQSAALTKVSGYLIDNACADSAKDLATSAENHSTSCALMDSCEQSGYSVMTPDKKRYKLDEKGNDGAAELLKNTHTKKGLKVAVEGTVKDDTISVTKLTEVTEAIN
ncbi:MAG: hypothetical protein ABR607_07150 [Pyrinomonadaceae bacterium]